ncbi:hypothetical protein DFW101_2221 [Solidesulfovibrio carbinoliphilus subsp. oakridgensis]|uniref:Uncharacterized protein n=1 Tax=Solidesulfovibrio carbinoliphilus subsp. oakridgensis TaxID=694327 RepID=G7QA75_9BACT|nr:hypothetical protein [Solidesulfovibrio carbinoliphilus]EHJ48226.1 hypothetical protein DFW101_2221 [Solidesulfovibrio carbinoliphilus subsp. oakridgensis]
MNRFARPFPALLAGLCLLALLAGRPAAAAPPGDIAGEWAASVLGQEVTASFTRQGDMIYGVIVIPDIGGGSNTYHVAGVVLGDQFAAQHASGHLLKGTMVGPNEAQAVFSPKSGPPLNLVLKRRHAP